MAHKLLSAWMRKVDPEPESTISGPHMYSKNCYCDSCSEWHEPPVKRTLNLDLVMKDVGCDACVSLPVSWLLEIANRVDASGGEGDALRTKCNEAIDSARIGKLPWDPVDPMLEVDTIILARLIRWLSGKEDE
jgi:hypothetical protein